jgi:hypothetical protein
MGNQHTSLKLNNDEEVLFFEEKYRDFKRYVYESPNQTCSSEYKYFFHTLSDVGKHHLDYLFLKSENKFCPYLKDIIIHAAKKKIYVNNKRIIEEYDNNIKNSRFSILWVFSGYKKTPIFFKKLYLKYCNCNADDNKQIMQRIKNLGILSLPSLLITLEEDCRKELIPVISSLVDNKICEQATVEETIQWWNENKKKYPMPEMEYPEEIYEKS